jgi:integrase
VPGAPGWAKRRTVVWYFAVRVPGADGRRAWVRRGGYATRAEAERVCWEVLQLPGPRVQARAWTVRRWLEFWLSEVEERLRPSTVRSYRTIVYQHLIPHLGRERLSKLRTVRVQRAMDAISRQRVRDGRLISAGTVSRIRAVLRSSLSEARRRGMIGHNPAWRLRLPDGSRPYAVVWDDEREAVWRETGLRPTVAVWDLRHLARFLVALCGPRRGEIAGLRWEDIDLAAGELTIREQVVVVGGTEYLGPPKSPAGVRRLALDEATVSILWELWRAQKRRLGGRVPSGVHPCGWAVGAAGLVDPPLRRTREAVGPAAGAVA